MKKNKLLGLLSLGLLAFSLAACDLSDLTSLLADSTKTETSNVEVIEDTEEEETTSTDDIVDSIGDTTISDTTETETSDTTDTAETEATDTATETETSDTTDTTETDASDTATDTEETPSTTADDSTVATNKYELLAQSLYQYEQDYTTLYGYQQLAADTNYGDLMTDVYEEFYLDAHEFLASDDDYEVYTSSSFNYIIVGEYEYSSSGYTDVIASAWITFIEENPLYYFTYTGYTIKTEGSGRNKTYSFCFLAGTDYADADDRYEANEAVLDMLTDFTDEYNALDSKDDYTVAKLIHDYICNKISYAYDSNGNASEEYWAHNILGVAMVGKGVCECYAETYLLLSYLTDLDCLIVLGSSGGGGHVWNYVKVDGVWYGVDATWDDGDTISYNYFLVSSTIMNKAHTAASSTSYGIEYQVALPTLSTTSYDTSLDTETTDSTGTTQTPSYPTITHGGHGGHHRW